ncbi:SDR family NAD(P)-dependent oxidoreductase [Collimonas sp.]|jgi:NAD(P)-dependent dehydrogenase (short-subunit alcohol dehydrogenase family)|uniref:SDR family NAD(P)-dependent oxidoreductase n=1 Tax=Collimonas sp. TaxID=1963772 RepID=UPI0037BFFDB6
MKPLNPPIKEWRNLRVWIIGASSGIGAETALLLLRKGARVALSARKTDALEKLAQDYSDALKLTLDITIPSSITAARDVIIQQWHGIDLILIVAGAYNEMRADNFDLNIANHLLATNLHGVFNCLDATLPVLLKQGTGAIGIVASVAGYSGLPKALVYGPSKAALINLAECLFLDLRPRGIGVYLVNPGFIDTPLTAGNDFKMPALMPAADAASELVKGLERGDFHLHFPKRFTTWLRLARLLPYRAYFALIHKVTGL